MNKPLKEKEIPWEVKEAWVIQTMGAVGSYLIDKLNAAIEKYPEYFQYEIKYRAVPQEVKNAYQEELNAFIDSIYPTNPDGPHTVYNGKLPPEEIMTVFKELHDRDEAIRKGTEEIWNRHYLKYGLKYYPHPYRRA